MERKTKRKRKPSAPKRRTRFLTLPATTTELTTLLTVMRWSRFSYERTPKISRRWLNDHLWTHANVTVSDPASDADVVAAIATHARPPIRLNHLSLELEREVSTRPRTVFGYAWNEIDNIAYNYEHMYWWISEDGLTIDTILPSPLPEEFDQIAGKLLFTMRQEFPNQRSLPKGKYLEIAAQLDQLKRFTPREVLSEEFHKELAAWNQQHGKDAILTFSQSMDATHPRWLRRQIMKRLYRAEENFKRRQGLLLHPRYS